MKARPVAILQKSQTCLYRKESAVALPLTIAGYATVAKFYFFDLFLR